MTEPDHLSMINRFLIGSFFSFTITLGIPLYRIYMYNLYIFLDKYEVNNSCLTSDVSLFKLGDNIRNGVKQNTHWPVIPSVEGTWIQKGVKWHSYMRNFQKCNQLLKIGKCPSVMRKTFVIESNIKFKKNQSNNISKFNK